MHFKNFIFRFDESENHIEFDYPRDMIMWSGVPYNIDSAFKYEGTVKYRLFFKIYFEYIINFFTRNYSQE